MRRAALILALALVATGCGSKDTPSDADQVRSTMLSFGKATAAHDYKRMCELLAPVLLDKLSQVGLQCEEALKQGLGDVRSPKLTVGRITVNGNAATAAVRSSAEGETPSDDTVALRKVNGSWRVSSLAGATGPGPAP